MSFEDVKKGSEIDLRLRSCGATEGLQYETSVVTIVTHANETLGGLRNSLLTTRLRKLIPSLDSPDISTGGGGDEINFSSESKICECFTVYINEFSHYSDSLCLSTILLLSSSEMCRSSPVESVNSNSDIKSL